MTGSRPPTPLVLFGYYNPFLGYGIPGLCRPARAAGADGFLVVDLPYEETREAVPAMREAGLDWIPLAAPTSGMERIREFDRAGSGFLYLISLTGVTGVRNSLPRASPRGHGRCRGWPGSRWRWGSASPRRAWPGKPSRHADAAVVGSTCVKVVEVHGRGRRGPAELQRFVRSLKSALR